MSTPDLPMWMCEVCWHPKDELEQVEYRRLYGIPPLGEFQCCLCGQPVPVEGTVAAYVLSELARREERRGSKSAALESRRTQLREIPKRRSYPLSEAAVLLGMSLSKLKEELRDGRISFVRVGKRRHVLDVEINRYLLRNTG